MKNLFELDEAAQKNGIQKMLRKLDEMLNDPAFIPAYLEHPVSCIEAENERLFGASFLESTALFYTCSAYHSIVKKNANAATLLSQGFAHYLLAFQIYMADLNYVRIHAMENFVEGDDLCLLGFARAIAYGFDDVGDWWGRQLIKIQDHNFDYLKQSMLDISLLNHMLLLLVCWHEKRWCRSDELIDDLGVYKPLWANAQDEGLRSLALDKCANYHLSEGLNNDYSPFGSMPYGPCPVELIAWKKLFERCFNQECRFSEHSLFNNVIVTNINPVSVYQDDWLNSIRSKAKSFYGTSWE